MYKLILSLIYSQKKETIMSFSQAVNKSINDAVTNFVKIVASTYKLSEAELTNLWNGVSSTAPQPAADQASPALMENADALSKLGKTELVAHCKLRGLKTTGNKQELIARLTGGEVVKPKSPSVSAKKESKAAEVPKVVKHIQSTIETHQIKKNSFGNFEHPETHIVFDKITKKAIGKQGKDGKIESLTMADIELCTKYKFQYTVPENLASQGKGGAVVIEGMDEEEEETGGGDIINEVEDLIEEEEEFVEEDGLIEDF